ncbi:MAG: fasciclin domain-containing protein [Phycisphaerae bacterium]|nr:fasciclin domain-containing protein [Phycisphaerae bacterium]
MKGPILGIALLALALGSPSPLGAAPGQPPTIAADRPRDLLLAIAARPGFTTLSRAIEAAGLAAALRGRGPFTLLAPSDEAFGKLPHDELKALFRPEQKARLAAILKYHLVSSRIDADGLSGSRAIETVNGQRVRVSAADGVVRVNEARAASPQFEADNGVVHALDAVLMPEERTVVQVLRGGGRHGEFLSLLAAADLLDSLGAEGPMTVFAPTDDAFAAFGAGPLAALKADGDALRRLARNHVLGDRRAYLDADRESRPLATASGAKLTLLFRDERAIVAGVTVRTPNIEASNGVVHVVDSVLAP